MTARAAGAARLTTVTATSAAVGAGVGVAPLALISTFGNTWPVLILYLPVVAVAIHAGTMLLRPYVWRPSRARAWTHSFVGATLVSVLMTGYGWMTLSSVEDRTRGDGYNAFHDWDIETLRAMLFGGWLIGFAVSFLTYWWLTRPQRPG